MTNRRAHALATGGLDGRYRDQGGFTRRDGPLDWRASGQHETTHDGTTAKVSMRRTEAGCNG